MTVPSFPGLYRAICVDSNDPRQMHRLLVQVPDVTALETSSWATPCQPPGRAVHVPAAGDGVWVMFEAGDPDYPVWMGVWE